MAAALVSLALYNIEAIQRVHSLVNCTEKNNNQNNTNEKQGYSDSIRTLNWSTHNLAL